MKQPDRARLRELARTRGAAERKSFSARSDAAKWKATFEAKERGSDVWADKLAGMFDRLDRKLNVKDGVRAAQAQWAKTTVAKAGSDGEEPGTQPPPPVAAPVVPATYGAILAAGGPDLIMQALTGGVKVKDFQQGAMAMYLGLALELAEEAGAGTLEALGMGKTWDWASYRDFARDEFAVRGSKIIQHAYGSHLDALSRMVIRKCDPKNPQTIHQLVKEIRKEWSRLAKYEAERIARTEAAAVWERMNYYALEKNGVEKVEWLIAHGPAIESGKVGPVCPICLKAKADGPYPVTGKGSLTDETMPPRHPNCFVAGTLVNGPPAIGTVSRYYTGDIVTVRTSSGNVITVTPNHPVLTPDGWMPIGSLHCGDYLIRDTFPERMCRADKDNYYGPIPIEQIGETFTAERLGYVGETAVEFHGDSSEGEVYIVRSDSFLNDRIRITSTQPVGQLDSTLCSGCLSEFIGLRTTNFLAKGHHQTTLGDVRSTDLGLPLLRSHLRPLEHFGVMLSTRGNAATFESIGDRPTSYSEKLRESFDRHSIVVSPDKIIDIKRSAFTGHVYNLETVDNWYSANGIIAHNCRCHLVPVLAPGWLPPAEPFEGFEEPNPLPIRKTIRAVASMEPEPVAKAFGWTSPPVPKAPALRSPLVAAIQGAQTGRKPLTAAQLAQRRAAARKKKGKRAKRA